MSELLQQIQAWYQRCDTRGLAHRSLVSDWIPENPDYALQLDNFAYGDTPFPVLEELLDWAGPFQSFVDLGCGCGIPTLVAADRCSRAVGYDLLPGVIEVARRAASELALPAEFHCADLGTAELRHADLVYVAATRFDLPLRERIARKLLELPPGARVVSVSYPFLEIQEERTRRFRWGDQEEETEHLLFLSRRTA